MSIIEIVIGQIIAHGPRFLVIFGFAIGVIEFLVRDKEIEIIRGFFTKIWYNIDLMSDKLAISTFIKSEFIIPIAIIGIISLTLFNILIINYSHLNLQNISYTYLFLIFACFNIIPISLFLIDRSYFKKYIDRIFKSRSITDMYFFSMRIPVLVFISTNISLANDVYEYFIFTIYTLYGVHLSYLTGLFLSINVIIILFSVAKSVMHILWRISLRVSEAKRGPVLAVAAVIAAVGVGLELLGIMKNS